MTANDAHRPIRSCYATRIMQPAFIIITMRTFVTRKIKSSDALVEARKQLIVYSATVSDATRAAAGREFQTTALETDPLSPSGVDAAAE